ncbi:hypothetical protein SAMN04488581_2603 [Mycolicibacterium neoaurum]|uniref:hypothetical protein n=1 Tax=Mycolicibacterium neoaurum TaxID=1795 RepID=UPI0005681B62|nr:hypothetical protein [Mycolicibacterium neoaurum]SDD58723.1 hypothetical protein SAMN04488581_2603 [Mycolicibacterium neoaurum]
MPKHGKRDVSVEEAKEQAADYFGFAESVIIKTNNGKFEIPNPGLLTDEQQQRYDELQADVATCDTKEVMVPIYDTEIIRDPDGTIRTVNKKVGERSEDITLIPHRKDGNLVKPPYNVRLAIALWGEDGYERFKTGGGIANQIGLEWTRMNQEYQERMESDPKSEKPSTSG